MTVRLFHTWKTYDIGSIAGTLTPVAVPVNWTIPAGKYLTPYEISSSYLVVSSAVNVLADRLNNAVTDPSYVYQCYYDNSINRVVLSCSIGNSGITFGSNAQTIFGFDASYPFWSVITASNPPFGVWTSTQENRAKDSDLYEQDAFIEERTSDNGTVYSTGRVTVGYFRDWQFLNEPKENVFIKYAPSGSYPWESFVKNIRKSADVFTLHNNVTKSLVTFEDREAVYLLKEERTAFKPRQIFPDYINHWNIDVNCRVYFPKHRDEREFPPGSLCELPGTIEAINPENGEVYFISPDQLEWSTAFDYGGSNANSYQVFLKEGDPAFGFPIAETTSSIQAIDNTSGQVYWQIVGSNQCGSTVSDVFNYQTVGASLSQSAITTDLSPYLYASGSGQAFSGSNTDHTFDYYGANVPRDIAAKVSQSGNWVIVESNIVNGLAFSSPLDFYDEWVSIYGSVFGVEDAYSTSFPINITGSFTAEATEFLVTGTFAEFTSQTFFPTSLEAGLPATFSVITKLRPASNAIVGFRIKNEDDDINLYYGVKLSNGSGSLGNANASYGFVSEASGSIIFRDDTGEQWAYNWIKYCPTDFFNTGTLTFYLCASTGSINDSWDFPVPNDPKVVIAFPQLQYLSQSSGTGHNENLISTAAMIPSSGAINLRKPTDRISGSFLSSFVASGSALKIRLVPSYSSSYSGVDRPIIHFPDNNHSLKLKQRTAGFTEASDLRAEIVNNSGSYSGSWQLGFKPGEKIDLIVDHDYNRVDWFQTSGYQNHFYFTGSWIDNVGDTFFLGSSGSSNVAFDGLMNISVTSSNPNAPMPPTGSNIEAELIAESIMWFDAAKGVTLSGSQLDLWNDQSPRAMFASRSAAARTAGAMEYFLTGGIGGEPGVYAAANGEYLVSGSMFESTGSWFTLYVVYSDEDTSPTSIRYHFDINNAVSSRRRIAVQKNGKRVGNWTAAFNVSSPGGAFPAATRYTNTGSQCFTYVMQGNETANIIDFVGTTTAMYKNRGMFARTLTNNMISHPECWVNTVNNFTLFGAINLAAAQRAAGTYSLICAFSGSHNETERQRVWDYIEGRFGVAQTIAPNYAFTSGTQPYQYTDASLIPSASINPDMFNKAFQFEFTLADWTQQNNVFWTNEGSNERFLILSSGPIRQYASGSNQFFAMGSLTGSNIGDRMRVMIDWERGNNLIENLTQNKMVGQQYWATPISMSYSNIQWLYSGSLNPGLGSGSWDVSAPWIFEDY